jgi:hypothetical protein
MLVLRVGSGMFGRVMSGSPGMVGVRLPGVGKEVSGGPGWVVCATEPSVVRWHAVTRPTANPRVATVAAVTRTCVFILATICR